MVTIQHAVNFLLGVIFNAFITCLMLRMLLQWVRADFYNPFSQFLVKITNPLLLPMRRVIPGMGGIDMAAIVLALSLEITLIILGGMLYGEQMGLLGALVMGIGQLLSLGIYVFIIGILIQVLISWVAPYPTHPLLPLLKRLTDPVMQPVRRRLKPIGGVDLSPLVVLVGLQLIIILVCTPIIEQGQRLAFWG